MKSKLNHINWIYSYFSNYSQARAVHMILKLHSQLLIIGYSSTESTWYHSTRKMTRKNNQKQNQQAMRRCKNKFIINFSYILEIWFVISLNEPSFYLVFPCFFAILPYFSIIFEFFHINLILLRLPGKRSQVRRHPLESELYKLPLRESKRSSDHLEMRIMNTI